MSRTEGVDNDPLSGWLRVAPVRRKVPRHWAQATVGTLRFAFYGRISTGEYQDAASWPHTSGNGRTFATPAGR